MNTRVCSRCHCLLSHRSHVDTIGLAVELHSHFAIDAAGRPCGDTDVEAPCCFMVWGLFGALGVYVARGLGLTAGQKGILVAIPMWGGSLFRIPMGVLTDRIGPKQAGTVGQRTVLPPLVWGWRFGNNLPQLLALGLSLGVARASFAGAGYVVVQRAVRRHLRRVCRLASFLAVFFDDQYGLSEDPLDL
jgi:hypothetical protein